MPHGFGLTDDDGGVLRNDYTLVPTPTHPKAQKLLDFWKARPADGIVIGRDVPSRVISDILSNLLVYEPVDGGKDLRVRLAGASIRRRFGGEITGKLMSELFPPDEFQDHLDIHSASLKAGKAKIVNSRLSQGAVEKMHLEVVVLPVAAPDRVSKWVLAGLFYFT